MAGTSLKSWIVFGLVATALAGCQPGTGGSGSSAEPAKAPAAADGTGTAAAKGATAIVASATTARLVDHDVEAPDVFQTTDKALWDGRPSLGGVWVATANAKDPERVILRNPANGKFVIGALFRREANNPGPKLQISSDAADALGMLAGQPATLNVTALRRKEAPATTDAAKPLLDAAETVQTTPVDQVAATANAAIAKAGNGPVIPTAPSTPPAPGKPAAKPAALGASPVAAAAPTVVGKPAKVGPSPAPAPTVLGKAAAQPAVEPIVAASPLPATPPVAAAQTGASIQIGIFSIEDNANRAVKTLAKSGITATVRKEESHGKLLWSVIASGDAATLAKIKSAGFADAYILKH